MLVVAIIAVLVMLAGCAPVDLLNAVVPREGYSVSRSIAYGEGPRRTLDIYRPDSAARDRPVVVYFYGGRWTSGAKEDYRFVGQAFAARGYVTVVPDYRLYPEVRFPEFIEDAARAVAWTKRHLAGNAPVYLVGHSAGAYIVAMLTLDDRFLARAGLAVCDTVSAAVGLAGPYNFLPLEADDLKDIFGPEETRALTQPIRYANGKAPPMLLATGHDDTTVVPANTRSLAARLDEKGARVATQFYDDVSHVTLAASLSEPLRGLSPAFEDTVRFLQTHQRTRNSCAEAPVP